MTVNQIVNISDKAKVSLQHNFIMQSFKELNPLLKELHEWWAINRQDELQQLYQQRVRYLM